MWTKFDGETPETAKCSNRMSFIPALEVTRKANGNIEHEVVPLHDGDDVRSRVQEFEEQGAYVSMVFLPVLDDD